MEKVTYYIKICPILLNYFAEVTRRFRCYLFYCSINFSKFNTLINIILLYYNNYRHINILLANFNVKDVVNSI